MLKEFIGADCCLVNLILVCLTAFILALYISYLKFHPELVRFYLLLFYEESLLKELK